MADIVELSHPDNVELVAGAVQNWADLPAPAAAEPLLRSVRAARLAGARRCLVVGPHAPALLREVAGRVELTVAVRAIVDAAAIGEACPTARVRCGQLPDALAGLGTFDLVVALDDVTRTQSLEAEPLPWADLAGAIRAAVAPGGTLLLAVENDLGVGNRLTLLDDEMFKNLQDIQLRNSLPLVCRCLCPLLICHLSSHSRFFFFWDDIAPPGFLNSPLILPATPENVIPFSLFLLLG